MTDDEIRKLGQVVADEVCRRADEEIKTLCLNLIYVTVAFWFVKMAIVFWKFWSLDD